MILSFSSYRLEFHHCFTMIFEHYMIPQVNEMMSNVHNGLSFDAYAGIVEGHSCLLPSLQCTKRVVISLCHRLLLFITIIIAWVLHVIVLINRRSFIKNWVVSSVPPSIANVKTPQESNLLIDDNHFSMVTPQADSITRMPHHLNIGMKSCQIFLSNQTVKCDCES